MRGEQFPRRDVADKIHWEQEQVGWRGEVDGIPCSCGSSHGRKGRARNFLAPVWQKKEDIDN